MNNLIDRVKECLDDHGKRLANIKDDPRDPASLQNQLIVEILIEIAKEIEVIKRKVA